MASIHLISVGSRGDLEPYLVLLKELKKRGHDVHLIGSTNFQEAVQDEGVRFTSLAGDFRELMASEDGVQLMEGKAIRLIKNNLLHEWIETARKAIDGCDLLLTPPLALWGYHLAEAEGCRFAVVSPIPLLSTTNFSFLSWPGDGSSNGSGPRNRIRGKLNQLSYEAIRLLKWRQESNVIQAFRHQQGLPQLPWNGASARQDTPPFLQSPTVLHLFSKHLIPKPADWPSQAKVTGFCLSTKEADHPYEPPEDLKHFLQEGPAPFYAGFGSMIPRDPEQLAEIIVTAACQANQRLILSPGWGHLLPKGRLPESVFVLEHCPHQWLFPQLQGAIHHGGAGTTASTLISGIPSIVVAFFADQPAWGRTLERLGVSPATYTAKTVTTDGLRKSLQSLAVTPSFKQRALQLQKLIQEEKGLSQTADALEHLIQPVGCDLELSKAESDRALQAQINSRRSTKSRQRRPNS